MVGGASWMSGPGVQILLGTYSHDSNLLRGPGVQILLDTYWHESNRSTAYGDCMVPWRFPGMCLGYFLVSSLVGVLAAGDPWEEGGGYALVFVR